MSGTCTCFFDSSNGYWDGTACDKCASEWYGDDCKQTCPRSKNLMCGGKGTCNPKTVACQCYANTTHGYWAGSACTQCASAYYGPGCVKSCPGGACNPCNQKGICDDGLNGTGTCTCFSDNSRGLWTGSGCTNCEPGFFGESCNLECPGGYKTPCNGSGSCRDGIFGDGKCLCLSDSVHGFWGGSNCDTCIYGFYGSKCLGVCPGYPPCGGNGVCDYGREGSGKCTCLSGYAGSSCQLQCPTSETGQICGHGSCNYGRDGTGKCTCSQNFVTGFWDGDACDECSPGFGGANCTIMCPGWPQAPCTSAEQGTCSQGKSGTGKCECSSGWAGVMCDKLCPGITGAPCMLRGLCDSLNATCTCWDNDLIGHFTGETCQECKTGWTGSQCNLACPRDAQGVICHGVGSCVAGACVDCQVGYCGAACNLTSGCVKCAAGEYRWGSNCQNRCPGIIQQSDGSKAACTSHGQCSEHTWGNGKCACDSGYSGPACEYSCPGGANNTCAGHGACQADGSCMCASWFGKADCSAACPGLYQNKVCSGTRGTCSDGSDGDGICTCIIGYAGRNCELECPGFTGNKACSGHGTCHELIGNCSCSYSASTGYWTGDKCDVCASGYQGSSCKQRCLFGISVNKGCQCKAFYGLSDCSKQCPVMQTVSGLVACQGHGTCSEGSTGTGECTCDTDYYTADCSVRCSPSECISDGLLMVHAICTSQGLCACQDNSTGHWTGSACDTCKMGYWGKTCSDSCSCNNHGSCQQVTGLCACYDDDINGHWQGDNCESCKDGYVGSSCIGEDVRITRGRNLISGYSVDTGTIPYQKAPDKGILLFDSATKLLYIGSSPLVVFNASASKIVASLSIPDGGIIVDGWIDELHDEARFLSQYGTTLTVYRLPLGIASTYLDQLQLLETQAARNRAVRTRVAPQSTISYSAAIFDSSVNQVYVVADSVLYITATAADGTLVLQPPYAGITAASSIIDTVTQATLYRKNGVSYVVLSGSFQGLWQLVLIDVNAWQAKSLLADLEFAPCDATSCLSASRFKIHEDRAVVAIKEENEERVGAYLVVIDLANSTVVAYSTVYEDAVTDVTISALSLDTFAGVGYVCLNPSKTVKSTAVVQPTTMYKFNLSTTVVIGANAFSFSGAEAERIVSLAADSQQRMMYGLTALKSLQVVTVNLFAIRRLVPDLADTKGGTVITVEGEGFISDELLPATCRFGSSSDNYTYNSASNVTVTSMFCVTERQASTGNDCDGQPLEVGLGLERFSQNKLSLRRIVSPAVQGVEVASASAAALMTGIALEDIVAYGSRAGGRVVTIKGFGFTQSDYIACKFWSRGYGDARYSRVSTGTVTFISAFELRCMQPSFASPTVAGVSYLDVSLDGQIFSLDGVSLSIFPNVQRYDVVGDAAGINVHLAGSASELISLSLQSSSVANVSMLSVFVVDEQRHSLFEIDDEKRTVSCQFSSNDTVLRGSLQVTSRNGLASFSDLHFILPKAGQYSLQFSSGIWSATITVTITPGDAVALKIVTEPSATSNQDGESAGSLEIQPELILIDVASNQVYSPPSGNIIVAANFFPLKYGPETQTKQASFDATTARFIFKGLSLQGKHGLLYQIVFNVTDASRGIRGTVSRLIETKACLSTQYAKQGKEKCYQCPSAGALCSGTTQLQSVAGYWRYKSSTDQSYVFYKCDKSDLCLHNDTCKEGAYGPLCSVCRQGYSGKHCNRCPKYTLSAMQAAAFALLVVVVLAGILAVNLNKKRKTKDILPVTLKMLISHLQVSSRLGEFATALPPMLGAFFSSQSKGSQVNINFDSLYCLISQMTYYQEFLCYVFFPALVCIPALLLPLFLAILRKREEIQLRNPARRRQWEAEREQMIAEGMIVRVRPLKEIFMVTMIIILYFAYPTLVQACGTMLKCQDLVIGEVDDNSYKWASYLYADRSIDCNSNEYSRYRFLAVLMIFIYGFGIPGGMLFIVKVARKLRGLEEANNIFIFIVAGYQPKRWFWEAVVMTRKFFVVLVVVFIRDLRLQTYVGMWVVSCALIVHWFLKPFTDARNNKLEALSLSVIVLTLNFGLLYDYMTENTPHYWALTVFLLLLHVMILGTFLGWIIRGLQQKIQKLVGTKESTMPKAVAAIISAKGEPKYKAPDLEIDDEIMPIEAEFPDSEAEDQYAPGDAAKPTKRDSSSGSGQSTHPYPKTPPVFSTKPDHTSSDSLKDQARTPASRSGPVDDFAEVKLEEDQKPTPPAARPSPRAVETNYISLPSNTARDHVLLLSDASPFSCRSVYLHYCNEYDVPPQPGLTLALPETPGFYGLTEWVVSPTSAVTKTDLLPLLEVLRLNNELTKLSFAGCNLTNAALEIIVDMAVDHPSLSCLDLSNNPALDNTAGMYLIWLAQRNERFVEVEVSGCNITDTTIPMHLSLCLRTNSERRRLRQRRTAKLTAW
eukprot:TRINITY_DN6927_c0_g1_i5.p1 TRINITY_DN6927_c0_g1~~TRINITY_DN6927_c0_g1_i5.p1  ORF type:complete len:2425 (+),score=246.00 TRINITY_DN6927_c0_g1_i5:6684-13958(+)